MGWFEENKELVNIGLIIVGIIIFVYYLIPHIVNTQVLASQVADMKEEIKALRKLIFKMKSE